MSPEKMIETLFAPAGANSARLSRHPEAERAPAAAQLIKNAKQRRSFAMKMVRTVTGDIPAAEMGFTYPHEHLHAVPPPQQKDRDL